jgi:3-phenylpropionate/trans-cinnamate dioxygenase ferredoxin reductase subunit
MAAIARVARAVQHRTAMAERVVIVGAGQAGAQVAISLRQLGFAGEVVLLGEESTPPYQRPPLSKALLSGEMTPERTLIRSDAYYAKSAIELRVDARVEEILRDRRAVRLAGGQTLPYDVLVLCTGAGARRLALPGTGLAGVLYLRTLADAARIRAAVRRGGRAVIVGGGYIGLEVAASLTKLGTEVTVVEALRRVMSRVVAPPVSDFFTREHAARGVAVLTGTEVAALDGDDRVSAVVTQDGRRLPAELVVIGVGAVPNDALARAAGVAIDNGIVVDERGRTSAEAIYAAGDVTNHPSPLFDRRVRLESVHNAMAQAKIVAQAIMGQPARYAEVPWFWSDQYDLKLQIAGLGGPDDELILRGNPDARAFSCLHLRNGRLVALDCVNRGADFLAGQKLIRQGASLDRARAADPAVRLGEL